jgi:protein polybromo-1
MNVGFEVHNILPQAELCHQLYDTIRNHKKEDGTLLCDAFIRVPKRRQEPGYYEVNRF